MIRKLCAIILIAGACNAYPYEGESSVKPTLKPISPEKDLVSPLRGPLEPEGPINHVEPERGQPINEGPVTPERNPVHSVDPDRNPLTVDNGPVVSPVRGPLEPERGQHINEDPVNPERNPVHSVDPGRDTLTVKNGPVPTEVPEDIPGPQNGPKPDESDLETDATFWWPYSTYRSSWSYPTYRTYWSYPSYRYYRPRKYYSYYFW